MARSLRYAIVHELPVRGGVFLALLILFFSASWWVLLLAGAAAVIFFPYPLEVLVLFLAYDLLFGIALPAAAFLPFSVPYFFLFGFLLWLGALFFHRLSRHQI